jgi:cyclophilin family peptidyl-prolyl cis-trans isomerase/HEAT repeat protein
LVFRMNKHACLGFGLALLASACASAPPAPPAPVVTFEQKLGWMLLLEDRRVLSDPDLAAPVGPALPPRRGAASAVPAFVPEPDLLVLARDPEGRVRRRAALAMGRVGLTDGLPALARLLQDAEPEVRAMAAFSIGLIGSTDGVAPLTAALSDPAPLVRGRAAEGLGIICTAPLNAATPCDAAVAPAIADMARASTADAAAMRGDAETAVTPEADAWRLAIYALTRIRDWDALSRVALDGGRPVTTWWPVAYALQRINNAAAVPALAELARANTVVGAAFAIRGLADHRAESFRALFTSTALDPGKDVRLRVAAVRALGRLPGAESSATLLTLIGTPQLDDNLRLEAVTALGAAGDASAAELLLDLIADDWPVMRATALGVVARLDPEGLPVVMSGLQPDEDWSVRAALARLAASLPEEAARPRIEELWNDPDIRVHGAALAAAIQAKLPEAEGWMQEALTRPGGGARSTAIAEIGRRRPAWGAAALREAYAAWAGEPDYAARNAALSALAQYGPEAARETLEAALSDRDWATRLQARALLARIDPEAATVEAIRPVPNTWPDGVYMHPSGVSPAYSPRVWIETRHGTIIIELDVVDAPLTAWNFLELARRGFYAGIPFHRVVPNFVIQAGDAGPGSARRTIRDELNPAPYLRGTVGMALAGPDTGGSQFFIMHAPAPHLDGRYTVFGKVISGMEVVDKIRQGDVIIRMHVVDGS